MSGHLSAWDGSLWKTASADRILLVSCKKKRRRISMVVQSFSSFGASDDDHTATLDCHSKDRHKSLDDHGNAPRPTYISVGLESFTSFGQGGGNISLKI